MGQRGLDGLDIAGAKHSGREDLHIAGTRLEGLDRLGRSEGPWHSNEPVRYALPYQ